MAFAVESDFASRDRGDISASIEKLHHLFSGTREFGPSRFCFGILFEPAKGAACKSEINLPQAAGRGAFRRIFHPVDFRNAGAIHQNLFPHREQNFV